MPIVMYNQMVRANPDPYNVSGTQSDIHITPPLFNLPTSISSVASSSTQPPLLRTLSTSPNKIVEEQENTSGDEHEEDEQFHQNGSNIDEHVDDYNNIHNTNSGGGGNAYKRSSYAESRSSSTIGRTADNRSSTSFSDTPSTSNPHEWQTTHQPHHHAKYYQSNE